MATRYYSLFNDAEGNTFKLWIYDSTKTVTDPDPQPARVSFNRDATNDLHQPIEATALQISLLATPEDDLSSIWQNDDRFYEVDLHKNDQRIFFGYLSNENIEFPFDAETYWLDVQALDPLAYLEDLAYVQANGSHWTGSATIIQVIARCLKRGFIATADVFGINARAGFEYSNGVDFLQNAYLDQDGFFDNDEPRSCKEVLEDVLLSIGCKVFQYEGKWQVVDIRQYALLASQDLELDNYDADGDYVTTATLSMLTDAQHDIGSDINDVAMFHVNKATRFVNQKYLQSVRLKHLYDYKDNFILNGDLNGSGGSMPNWTLQAGATATDTAIEVDGVATTGEIANQAASASRYVLQGQTVKFTFDVEYITNAVNQSIYFFLFDSDNSTSYYLRGSTSSDPYWSLSSGSFYFVDTEDEFNGVITHELTVEIPVNGYFFMSLRNGYFGGNHTASSKTIFNRISAEVTDATFDGTEHTANRNDNDKGRVDEVIEIPYATKDTDTAWNVFLQSDGVFMSSIYSYLGSTSTLEYIANERLIMEQSNNFLFRGDVYGAMEGLGPRGEASTSKNYLITRLSKDLISNISNVEMRSLQTNTNANIDHEEKTIYKESVKVKIVT